MIATLLMLIWIAVGDTFSYQFVVFVLSSITICADHFGNDLKQIDYKLVSGTIEPEADKETTWEWQPGPNRILLLDAAAKTVSKGMVNVFENWIPSRRGSDTIVVDGYLSPHEGHLRERYKLYEELVAHIELYQGGLNEFSRGYLEYGFTRSVQNGVPGISFREWAPGAKSIALVGDFNNWNKESHKLTRDEFGVWSIFLPDLETGAEAITHESYIRLWVQGANDECGWRLPAWIRYTTYDPTYNEYVGRYWNPPPKQRYGWKHKRMHTKFAASYHDVPGLHMLPSYSDWLGKVSFEEVAEALMDSSIRSAKLNLFDSATKYADTEDLLKKKQEEYKQIVGSFSQALHQANKSNTLDDVSAAESLLHSTQRTGDDKPSSTAGEVPSSDQLMREGVGECRLRIVLFSQYDFHCTAIRKCVIVHTL